MHALLFLFGISSLSGVFGQVEFDSDKAFQRYLKKHVKLAKAYNYENFNKDLTQEAIKADLSILKWTLEEAQTTIYRYTNKQRVDSLFQCTLEQAQIDTSYLGLIRSISRIQNEIACGHSGWGHNPDYFEYRNKYVKLFPFQIVRENERWYIHENYSHDKTIPDRAEITHINGIRMDSIANKLKQHIVRDGTSNDESSHNSIAKFFPMAYSNFMDNPDAFSIKIYDPEESQQRNIIVEPLYKNEISKLKESRYPQTKKDELPLLLKLDRKKSSALFTIKSFNKKYHASKGQDFERFTDSVFDVLATNQIKHLFIDLRGNT